jgi:hypothetical protein
MRVPAIGSQARRGPPAGLLSRGSRQRVRSIPAPYGGWNARDALTAMPPEDAISLDNFIPDAGGVRVRAGLDDHATGLNGTVQSLLEYNPPSGTVKLFGATADTIWDCTSAGAASSAVAGLTNGRWQHVNFATTGGNFLIACNGADTARTYDGTTWADLNITGVSEADLIGVTAHKNRLWFVEKDSMSAWHLDVRAIAGAATELPLGSFCKLGGYLLAVASWTRDGGSGLDDYLVFITSKGEAIVYQGTDPTVAANWSMVGVFRIPEPIGRRCVVSLGGDLGVITSQGLLPFAGVLSLSSAGAAKIAATDKISRAFDEAYAGASTFFGWQVIEFPRDRILIVNVPVTELSRSYQFVMNTQNGNWCRFKDIDAFCWGLKGDELYFGGLNTVYKYGGGLSSDNGVEINARSISAFNSLGNNNNKAVTQARPMISAVADYSPSIGLLTDFNDQEVNLVTSSSGSGGSVWDEAEWDVAEWAPGVINQAKWRSLSGFGSTFAFVLSASTQDQFRFDRVDLMVDDAGYV